MNPIVSFIIPSYNEEGTIQKCLDSLLDLDYPKECLDIVVVDGGSQDNTIPIIEQYKDVKLYKYLVNKPKARNIAVEKSRGEYLFNFSGHAVAERNLLSKILPKFNNGVHIVGVPNHTPNKNEIGQDIGKAFKGFFAGIGTNIYMQNATTKQDTYVAHVPFCCYKKEVFDKVGLFNYDLQYGQDAEFNIRCRKHGYKILFTPDTHVKLYKPNSYMKLFWKMYNYGIARAEILRLHPDTFSSFYILPMLFIPGLLALLLLTLFGVIPGILFALLVFTYLFLCFMSCSAVRSIIIYPLIHLGYGYGLLRGML